MVCHRSSVSRFFFFNSRRGGTGRTKMVCHRDPCTKLLIFFTHLYFFDYFFTTDTFFLFLLYTILYFKYVQALTDARTLARPPSAPLSPTLPLSPAPLSLRIEDRLGILLTPTNTCCNARKPAFILLLFRSLLPALSGSLTLIYYDIFKQTHACDNAWRPVLILLLFLLFFSLCRCRFFLPALCGSRRCSPTRTCVFRTFADLKRSYIMIL